jgi:hypothetical protein
VYLNNKNKMKEKTDICSIQKQCSTNFLTHDFGYMAGNFSIHHCIQTGSGAHPASYPVGTRGSFSGGTVGWV